jgi:hypothetical protein
MLIVLRDPNAVCAASWWVSPNPLGGESAEKATSASQLSSVG